MIVCFLTPQIGIASERGRCPVLLDRPLVLVDDSQKLLVVSDEAAFCGVACGQTLSGARALCPSLQSLPYDTAFYEDCARGLWDLFAAESSCLEPVSPELCYLEVPDRYAEERTRFLIAGLTSLVAIRAGLGRTKIVARMAARSGRQEIVIVPLGEESRFLSAIPISRATSLDPRILDRLERLGLKTFGDILRTPLHRFPAALRKTGYLLRGMAVGDDGDPVRASWPLKSVSRHFVFEEGAELEPVLRAALNSVAWEISTELALSSEFTKRVRLELSLNDGRRLEDAMELRRPASDQKTIASSAARLLERLAVDCPVDRLALTASEITQGDAKQLTLMDARALGALYPHERDLEAAVGYLQQRFGRRAVVSAQVIGGSRRIGLWTYPLGLLLSEPIQVVTDAAGLPMRYVRKSGSYQVARIANRWKETKWRWERIEDTLHYRVETDPAGLYEIEQSGSRWRLTGAAD